MSVLFSNRLLTTQDNVCDVQLPFNMCDVVQL